ncbi:hypothetical protein PDJAM_G00215520 [Pangasius djambal]|uniref:Uncharacterized protein n=1 Tax=Pangasius djambal TaxID=1691987 RepID=A0ACC5YAP7_9TELE|nr:hypothetical protein [Pangasius djambal]
MRNSVIWNSPGTELSGIEKSGLTFLTCCHPKLHPSTRILSHQQCHRHTLLSPQLCCEESSVSCMDLLFSISYFHFLEVSVHP